MEEEVVQEKAEEPEDKGSLRRSTRFALKRKEPIKEDIPEAKPKFKKTKKTSKQRINKRQVKKNIIFYFIYERKQFIKIKTRVFLL